MEFSGGQPWLVNALARESVEKIHGFRYGEPITPADIETAKARIALAENDMVYTKVLSPISGTVGETKIRVGNNVSPQTGELVSIVQSDPIDIQFALSESDFYRSFDGRTLKGNVRLEVRRADGEAVDMSKINGVLVVATGDDIASLAPKAIPAANISYAAGAATVFVPSSAGAFAQARIIAAAPNSPLVP